MSEYRLILVLNNDIFKKMMQKLKVIRIIVAMGSLFAAFTFIPPAGAVLPGDGGGSATTGCAGSTAPTGTDCSTIPAGCPGSAQAGPVAKTAKLTCPYNPAAGSGYKCPGASCTYGVAAKPSPVTGPGDTAATSGNCASVSKCDLITKYINPFIKFISALFGLIVVISIIIGGIQYGSSAGDPQKAAAARNRIRNAIIALVTYIFLLSLLNFLIPGGLV